MNWSHCDSSAINEHSMSLHGAIVDFAVGADMDTSLNCPRCPISPSRLKRRDGETTIAVRSGLRSARPSREEVADRFSPPLLSLGLTSPCCFFSCRPCGVEKQTHEGQSLFSL
jgi:hypothetical protein